MKLKIFLDDNSYKYLSEHVPDQPLGRTAISQAVLLGNTRVVDCNDIIARELLACAQRHCPGAAHRIIEAMNLAGLTIE